MDRKTYVFLSPKSRTKAPAECPGHKVEKIEGHMTLYLDSENQESKSEDGNQKIECHTTFYLEGNIQIKRAKSGSVSCLLSGFISLYSWRFSYRLTSFLV